MSKRRRAAQKPGPESSLPLWLNSKLTSTNTPADGLRRPARAQMRVRWTHLFTVRIGYTLFFLFLTASNAFFLAWLFARKSSFAWNEVVFVIADALGSLSAASYLVCGCFYPRQPKPVLSNKQLLELGRTEHAAVVQCHYNEPTEDIVSALRYNLKHFQEFGCSRASRKYYICDDGFYTGSGDEQRRRQMAFCRALRGVVREVLGEKPGFEENITDLAKGANASREPLALAEGTYVDTSDICRADCAEGFLIWCVGRPQDHVYLVARKKPPVHHAKAGNINNFLYNVLRHQYAPEGVLRLANDDGPAPNYVLLLDQDMCLGHEFVKAQPYYRPVEIVSMALPVMETDLRRTAFVQFPQHFFDMHRMDITFSSNATFYNGVEVGRGAVGLASFSGTNCVWDVSKLFSIGGLQYGSVTEDANTAMVAQGYGFRSRYVDAPVAAGNSPQTVEAVVKQVCARWALGSIEMLFQRCGCSTRPERLCDDQFRVPPPGLKDAYGFGEYDHFDAAQKDSMRRGCLEWMLMHIFCIETMVFPFWSFGALLHLILASNFLITLAPPLKFDTAVPSTTELPSPSAHSAIRDTWPIYVLLAHAALNTLAPLFAFPRVRVKDMLRSMCAWMGLAPTMITHAVLSGVWEKMSCCKSKAKRNWTSIRDGSDVIYTPVFMVLFCGLLLASLMTFRSMECIASPDVPEQECPSAGNGGLPDWAEDSCNCEWAYGTPWNDDFQAGGICQTTEDDFSVCRCFCCCDYVGECGYAHVHEKHTLRPVGSDGPCNTTATLMAVLYGGLLLALLSPWLYAVLRDLRKIGRPRSFYDECDNADPLTELAQKLEIMRCTSSSSDVNLLEHR